MPLQVSDSDICPKLNDVGEKKLVSSMLSEFIAANATQYYKVLTLKSITTYFRTFSQWENNLEGTSITKVESTCNFTTFINKIGLKTHNYFQYITKNSKSIKRINILFQLL